MEDQSDFALGVAWLILKASSMGYKVTLGDAYRDPRVFGNVGEKRGYGSANSKHKRRLAIDLNLFKDGVFLDATGDHEPLGAAWEKQFYPNSRWGGHFGDGNHYQWGS